MLYTPPAVVPYYVLGSQLPLFSEKFIFALKKSFCGCLVSHISVLTMVMIASFDFILYPLCGLQKYEQELFKLALPCLSAVAGALPPDYMESNYVNMMEKQSSMDSDGNFNPQPVDTSK